MCHDSDLHHVEQRERVFLRPQWLVDVMKALVHHDLAGRIDGVGSAVTNAAEVKSLGKHFMLTGELDRRLLPWLWRELEPPVGDDDAQMSFLVSLLVQLGLLTELPADDAAAASGGEGGVQGAGAARWLLHERVKYDFNDPNMEIGVNSSRCPHSHRPPRSTTRAPHTHCYLWQVGGGT